MIKVYNTLTREKEIFKSIIPGKINMYVCGPTVYNYIHIGNARSSIAFDVVRRYFEYRGYQVNYVSNFTDVDDKIIQRAREEGVDEMTIANKYANAFIEDTLPLNIQPATVRARATEVIPDIIVFVQDLIDKGYAYEAKGDVYFRAKKFKGYGILAHQDLNEMTENAAGRLDDEEMMRKEDPIDFAVWKATQAEDEISWESPWGNGRPGWHIECSVMAQKYLSNTIDIHGGGIDLAFPHHTNEMAQSEAHTGQKFVNYWMHNGFVNVNNEKMSKSLGNFTTIHDMLKHYDDPMTIRLLLATTQYRRPINYSSDTLTQARVALDRIRTGYRNLLFRLNNADVGKDADLDITIKKQIAVFEMAMDDDFNTPNALAAVFELVTLANTYADNKTVKVETVQYLLDTILLLLGVFGITELNDKPQITDAQKQLLAARVSARAAHDFELSDQIRQQLSEGGVIVEDTAQGQRWHQA
ncbi:cysteine--tRNA ligase [Leuconostoc gelidum subsp. aenigmaticum]|uniref:cysteine--tRNA ligase n=1 Tax=Leuconostoc gelidum TaxID=1244 RepID=UPI0015763E16|nr:cysteine--tRNA ligase [Leuconostoc gelidum]MBZ5978828.1 cysteine--tRNA ligase [Leuconostoc gelidum subsp. gelidum]MBZ6001838.1 cysteine--tRNA ligase [Leuconostoc gelidum subsp. gelidum]MBZ6003520.1 cysteine--tRNA ligase [Leuconostoc gelidum subsp. aenigmaticum]MBZ6009790.1 cysteine--tRNA ligase [Leuconostoc gelidum subsp. aenigmaticum]QDJ29293.1 cysteine--tRNA ligase [Leuconostoc gelidum subsp. gelidum]